MSTESTDLEDVFDAVRKGEDLPLGKVAEEQEAPEVEETPEPESEAVDAAEEAEPVPETEETTPPEPQPKPEPAKAEEPDMIPRSTLDAARHRAREAEVIAAEIPALKAQVEALLKRFEQPPQAEAKPELPDVITDEQAYGEAVIRQAEERAERRAMEIVREAEKDRRVDVLNRSRAGLLATEGIDPEEVDKAEAWFQGEGKKNPAYMASRLWSGEDPYTVVLREYRNNQIMQQAGGDLAAYVASLNASQPAPSPAPPPAAPPPPATTAGTASLGARAPADPYASPVDLEGLFDGIRAQNVNDAWPSGR